jgi:probable rRNA maturation factor
MILLDSDLDADAAPRATAVKRVTAPAKSLRFRLPTARTLARFLAAAQAAVRLRGQVTVLLTTDAVLRNLNRRFRGKNKSTDVLSFPADTAIPGSKHLTEPSAEKIAGDLAISIPTARRQAAEQGHSLSTEVKVLILHGVLHLAGYDHEADAGEMERRERLLRGRLGLPLGLIERAARHPEGTRPRPFKVETKAKRL